MYKQTINFCKSPDNLQTLSSSKGKKQLRKYVHTESDEAVGVVLQTYHLFMAAEKKNFYTVNTSVIISIYQYAEYVLSIYINLSQTASKNDIKL